VAVGARALVVDHVGEGPRAAGLVDQAGQQEPERLHDTRRHRIACLGAVVEPVEGTDGSGHEPATGIRVRNRSRLTLTGDFTSEGGAAADDEETGNDRRPSNQLAHVTLPLCPRHAPCVTIPRP